MRKQIEEAIRTTLVVENKESIHFAIDKILLLLDVSKGKGIEREPAVCDHHWLGVGYWDGYAMEQCTKCNLFREAN